MSRVIARIDITGALGFLAYDGAENPAGFLTHIDIAGYATTSQLDARIAALVNGAPGTLDTLAELAAQLQQDEAGAASLAALVATKQTAAQVAAAIAAGTASGISGILDIAHGGTGASNTTDARAALGLGSAATRGIGLVAGTVAAGDDARITAAQTAGQVDQAIAMRLVGYSPASTVTAQINAAIAAGTAANVSGVVALANGGTGATSAPDARAALGLGGAALLAVGTAAGTVAAGDDGRITAAQTAGQVDQAITGRLATYAPESKTTAQIQAAVATGTAANVSGVVALANGGTGATSASDARTALGLGGAATLPVGTTVNTVAAGNDPRILAAQTAGQVGAAIAAGLAGYATTSSVQAQLADLVNAAPATLDTLGELAAQLQQDEAGAASLAALVGTKQTASQVQAAIAGGTAANVSGTVALANGGTGATTAAGALARLGAAPLVTPNFQVNAFITATGGNSADLNLTSDSSTTAPRKTIRSLGGNLEVVNSAYTAVILGLTDDGDLTVRSASTAEGLLASRAYVVEHALPQLNPVTQGPLHVVDPDPNGSAQVSIDGSASASGANLVLRGNGGTTPNKFIRANAGQLEFINSAHNAVIASLDDAGNFSAADLYASRSRSLSAGVLGAPNGANTWGTHQGLWQGWNLDSGQGHSDLINSRGGGAGGFDFWNVDTDPAKAPTRLMRIDDAGAVTVPEGRLATRAWADARYTPEISVRGFGAAGNGVIDDTAAFQNAINAAGGLGVAWHVPGGLYRLSSQLVIANGPFSLVGEGMGVSVLTWDAGGTRGIKVSQDSDRHPASIGGVSLRTKGQGGAAITIDTTPQITPNNGDPVVVNRYSPRFSLRDVEACSDTDPFNQYWEGGCDLVSTVIAVLHNFNFEGGYGSPGVFKALYGVRASGGGHPTQVTINASSFYGVQNGIVAAGVEGLHIGTTNVVGVTNGVTFDDSANPNSARPLCVITGSHINACGAGVIANNVNDLILTGNDIYFCIDAQADGIGVLILGRESSNCLIQGNSFVNTSQTYGYTGIVLTKAAGTLVNNNLFHRTRFNANAPFSGILIRADSVNTRIGADNHFNIDAGVGDFVFRVLDQGVNSILPGMGAIVSLKQARQAIQPYTATNVSFDGPEQFVANNAWWTASDPTELQVHVAGRYQLGATVGWDDTPDGFRLAEIRRAGNRVSGLPSATTNAASGMSASMTLTSALIQCAAGDVFTLLVISSVAAQVDNDGRTSFSITRLGD